MTVDELRLECLREAVKHEAHRFQQGNPRLDQETTLALARKFFEFTIGVEKK